MKSVNQAQYPPIPAETARLAVKTIDKSNKYLHFGEQIAPVFNEIIPLERMLMGSRVGETYCLYALICAVQFGEKATDSRIVREIDARVDLKYALHLPLQYPKFDPLVICEFRQQLLAEPVDYLFFDRLVSRLEDWGYFGTGGKGKLSALDVLIPACYASQLDWFITDAARLCEKALAGMSGGDVLRVAENCSDALKNIKVSPEWPDTGQGWQELILRVGDEIHLSFLKVEEDHRQIAPLPPDYVSQKDRWLGQFEEFYRQVGSTPEHIWGQQRCVSCSHNNSN